MRCMTHRPSPKVLAIALNTAGALFALAAIYHLQAIVWRRVDASDSTARHCLFVIIDISVAFGMFRRPRFFFWLFALLGLQQLHSHGSALIRALSNRKRWIGNHCSCWS